MTGLLPRALPWLLPLALGGCEGVQSELAPEGPEDERVPLVSWIMFTGGAAILLLVVLLTALALYGPQLPRERLGTQRIVIGGGIVFPVVTLSALLAYGLFIMAAGQAESDGRDSVGSPAEARSGDAIRIAVVGEQWWWRIIYQDADGRSFESANEIRIPVGRPVELELTSADVIHSFWVPKLAGKLDMIPGRTNRMRIVANQPGVMRGQCAEYCGGAHALMAFQVVALEEEEFAAWLERESGPALVPETPALRQGRELFLNSGCGGCHSVRGTSAEGTIGPDLTHVGGRLTIAAAILPSEPEAFARWIAENQHIKPENRMPPFRIFSEAELAALAAYLESLE